MERTVPAMVSCDRPTCGFGRIMFAIMLAGVVCNGRSDAKFGELGNLDRLAVSLTCFGRTGLSVAPNGFGGGIAGPPPTLPVPPEGSALPICGGGGRPRTVPPAIGFWLRIGGGPRIAADDWAPC